MKMATGEWSMVKGGGRIFAAAVVALGAGVGGVRLRIRRLRARNRLRQKAAVKKEIGLNAIFETSMGTVKVTLKKRRCNGGNFRNWLRVRESGQTRRQVRRARRNFMTGWRFTV